MNGIHDMGGMHGMGPIEYDKNEPPFREAWEGRVWALLSAMGPFNTGKRRSFRYELESFPPSQYLSMSYYERFAKLLVDRLLGSSLITRAELESGRADPATPKVSPRLTPPMVAERLGRRGSLRVEGSRVRPRFRMGQRVRARNIHPIGHTRLPRYLRGKRGSIVQDHGVFDLQDTDADGYALGEQPQHVYTVKFAARELWGEQATSRDSVYADLWDDYLERA